MADTLVDESGTPYRESDGLRIIIPRDADGMTMAPEDVYPWFVDMSANGGLDGFFRGMPAGFRVTFPAFLDVMRNPANLPVLVQTAGDNPARLGLYILDDMCDQSCRGHLCIAPRAYGKLGVAVTRWALLQMFLPGQLKIIIGETPETNPLAVRFAKRCGFQVIGTVPGAIFDRRKQQMVGRVISYVTPETMIKAR